MAQIILTFIDIFASEKLIQEENAGALSIIL